MSSRRVAEILDEVLEGFTGAEPPPDFAARARAHAMRALAEGRGDDPMPIIEPTPPPVAPISAARAHHPWRTPLLVAAGVLVGSLAVLALVNEQPAEEPALSVVGEPRDRVVEPRRGAAEASRGAAEATSRATEPSRGAVDEVVEPPPSQPPPKTEAELEAGDQAWCALLGEVDELRTHYPFADEGTDLPLETLTRVLGPRGSVWAFHREYLASELPRVEGRISAEGSRLEPEVAEFFSQADRVTHAFFPGGGSKPSFSIDLRRWSIPGNGFARLNMSVGNERSVVPKPGGTVLSGALSWPGPEPDEGAQMVFTGFGVLLELDREGPWGLFHLVEEAEARPSDEGVVLALDVEATDMPENVPEVLLGLGDAFEIDGSVLRPMAAMRQLSMPASWRAGMADCKR